MGTRGESGCPACGGETTVRYAGARDDRYGAPGGYDLRRCGNCGHCHLDASFTPQEMARLYTDFYPRGERSIADYRPRAPVAGLASWFAGERRQAYSWVPPGVRVLDVGCGFGETLGYHRARGCDVHGVEVDENARRVAEAFGFDIRIGIFDSGDWPPGSFDYVTMDQVIEHVADPVATLAGVARILRPGGRLVVSTPNAGGWGARFFGRRWINWHVPYHLQDFTRDSLRRVANRAGMRVVMLRTVTSSEWLHFQWSHLVTYPQQGRPSAFWSRSVTPTRAEQIGLLGARILHRTRMNHVWTRAMDAVGLGDNLLAVMEKD